jgi:hypothetical protein
MRDFLMKLSSPAGIRTVIACLCLESLVLVVLYFFTRSLAGSVIISIIALGPLSLFFAGPIYRRFSKSR